MRAAVAAQYLLPHRLLTRVVRWATRWTFAPWKNALIRNFATRYRVDLGEAENPDITAYENFNAFFTRALKSGARPTDADPDAVLSPADGRISQAGRIDHGRIFQAKGFDFGTGDLLGDDARAAAYHDGSFITVYLSPRDYHRVHMPLAGELIETVHVPGRLFGVAPFAVTAIPHLFARNERLVCHFDSALGPFTVVLVGAMLVSGIATVWDGVAVPPYATTIVRRDCRGRGIWLKRGAELGRFEMGSTVIVLLPVKLGHFSAQLVAEQTVRVGQKVGTLGQREVG
ncbi:MAG TPA: archaetidylserine decarboxylase [Rhodanobacteraceae bacterium]|jgi:phosphatidylserine decarboxylase|nr:archaetidylserine decarboxylase [Rhodanobacteraceae bacterium]